ncbi:MAG: BamA/TamA family outer membrane protein [Sandaracinaceae bacterium]
MDRMRSVPSHCAQTARHAAWVLVLLLSTSPAWAQVAPADEEASASGSETEDGPPEDAPASDAPASDAPANGTPASGTPASDAPASDAPASDAPGANGAPEEDLPAHVTEVADEVTEPDPEPEPTEARASTSPGRIEYVLERIEVRGNDRTDDNAIRPFIPLRVGEALDVDDPRIETIRWRLLSTGWFDEVRLGLERGSERGRVVLVVEVSERNTFVVQGLAFGVSEGVLNSDDASVDLEPYFGISLAEQNLFGTGVSLQATGLLSVPQQGVRVRAGQAAVAGTDWGLTGTLFFANGREFFGNDDVVIALDTCPMRLPEDPACEESRNAVVVYRRYGASLGTGTDLGTTLRFTADYGFEAIEVVDRPAAASHRRGAETVPIDFAVHDGWSFLSTLSLGLAHDERDNPGLPTQGRYVFLDADISTTLIGSSYDFVRVRAGWREWFRLPEARHTLRLGIFAGAGVGDVPFFYRFYASDLSDLIPSRVLQMNLDRRAPPNLLDTSVREMRAQELAGRVDIEYSLWLYEGDDAVRGLILYGMVGLYTLLDRDDLRIAIPGYEGFARAPLDLTFDVGLRLDTMVGVFELGFSTLLGFISL